MKKVYKKNKIYFLYILLGLLCPVVIVIYYIHHIACMNAIRLEIITGILTTCFAIIAFKENMRKGKPIGHWLAALMPLICIPLIPVVMIAHSGLEGFLTKGIIVFITMECFAISQFALAILMFRGLIFKRGEDRLMMPGVGFMIMKTVLRIRNIFRKPGRILRKMKLKEGQTFLDYGCGIGSFTIPASKLVGKSGKVYALDIHRLAIKAVEKEIKKRKISNIKTILSDRKTGLPDESVDIVLLYDVLQMVREKEKLFEELHRVLKPDGTLFATSEHLKVSEFLDVITKEKLFILIDQEGKLFRFKKR